MSLTWKIIADGPYHLEENTEGPLTLPALYPKHYLQQFHPKYQNADTLDAMVKEGGFVNWVDLMENKTNRWYEDANVDKPVLRAWQVVQGLPAKTTIWKRNPYFHIVDIAGNQLPYFDEVHMESVADVETAKLRAIAGEDHAFTTQSLDFFPVAKQAEAQGTIKGYPVGPFPVQHGHHRVQHDRGGSRASEDLPGQELPLWGVACPSIES